MKTSTIPVDYLIIGTQSSIWIFFILASINSIVKSDSTLEYLHDTMLNNVSGNNSLLYAFAATALVYTIGVITNDIYRYWIFKNKWIGSNWDIRWLNWLKKIHEDKILDDYIINNKKEKIDLNGVLNYVYLHKQYLAERFDNWKSRKNLILRNTFVNFMFIGISIIPFTYAEFRTYRPSLELILIIIAIWGFAIVAIIRWRARIKKYYSDLYGIYEQLDPTIQEKLFLKEKER